MHFKMFLDIVHRDVKMENILLAINPEDHSDEYYIKLTDFGLSIIKTGVGIKSLMTEYCGTIIYMRKYHLDFTSLV